MRHGLTLVLALTAAACGGTPSSSLTGDAGLSDAAPPEPPPDAMPPPPPRVRFVAMGDTGEGNPDQRRVAVAIRDLCAARGCDFVLLLGDNIYDEGVSSLDDPQWQTKFEEPYRDIDLPFQTALGNHDYGGRLLFPIPGLGNEFTKSDFEVMYSERSRKWIMPSQHYTFSYGHVGFIVLDTNSLMWADTSHGDQREWWPTALMELQGKEWLFVVGHHPYRSNGSHGNAGSYDAPELGGVPLPNPIPQLNGTSLKQFFDEVVCGTGDVYLCGHDHSRQWLDAPDALCGTELIVSGAGSKVTNLRDHDNRSYYEDASEVGFLYVDIEGKRMTGGFYDADGNLDFERIIEHP